MSKRANPAIIGLFVVCAIFLGVFGLYLFGSEKLFTKSQSYLICFNESVNGLDDGALVKFKGVEVGKIVDILVQYDPVKKDAYVPVIIDIVKKHTHLNIANELILYDKDAMKTHIENGLRGKLTLQSYLTGKLFIELDFIPDAEPSKPYDKNSKYPQIPTVRSGLDELWKGANTLVKKISTVDFETIGRNINSTFEKLNKGLDKVDFKNVNDSFIHTMRDLRKLANDADAQIDPFFKDARNTFKHATDAFDSVQKTADNVSDVVQPDSTLSYNFDRALRDISAAAKSIKNFTDYLERNPRSLLTGKQIPEAYEPEK